MEIFQNGILVAIVAHGLIGISLVWDKILLRRRATGNLVSYVFWMGAISIFGVILAFFGFRMPPLSIALLAFGAGALQMLSVFFYYVALKRGEASEALAVMGGFSPVATALIGLGLLQHPIGHAGVLGFTLMVGGGFVMFATEKFDIPKLLAPVLIASGTYGLVNVTQKIAFNHTNFVSGYVLFTLGTFSGAMFLLTRASWRKQIYENSGEAKPSSKFWYMMNRFLNGVGSFLIFYAISLESPAVVDAISAVRYVIIFLGAFLLTMWRPHWLREDFHGAVLFGKVAATVLVGVGLAVVGMREGPVAGNLWPHNASNPTPQATTQAPSHRCQRTSSFRMNFASAVSNR